MLSLAAEGIARRSITSLAGAFVIMLIGSLQSWLLFGKHWSVAPPLQEERARAFPLSANLSGGHMLTTYVYYGLLIALAIALLYAAFTDIRSRTIANSLNLAIAALAPVFWWASGLSLWPDVVIQLGIALAAFAVFAGLFALGMMGGGDVKLLTALALWIEPMALRSS